MSEELSAKAKAALLELNERTGSDQPLMVEWDIQTELEKRDLLWISYEHSLASAPEDYIAKIPSQVVKDVPANIPRALLPEYIADLILKRSARIGKIRHLRIL